MLWRLPENFPTVDRIITAAERYDVRVHSIESAGAFDFGSPYLERCLVLGYSALSEGEIRAGVDALAKAIGEVRPAG